MFFKRCIILLLTINLNCALSAMECKEESEVVQECEETSIDYIAASDYGEIYERCILPENKPFCQ